MIPSDISVAHPLRECAGRTRTEEQGKAERARVGDREEREALSEAGRGSGHATKGDFKHRA